jgi:hypothetical protein
MTLTLIVFAALQLVSIVVMLAFFILETRRGDENSSSRREAFRRPKTKAAATRRRGSKSWRAKLRLAERPDVRRVHSTGGR